MADLSTLESKLESEKPTDRVIARIKELVISGILKPGDRLPAERKMAQEFGVGRTQVREALHKLEFYGIIQTLPQSGSVIKGLDINTLDGLISDVLDLQVYDFYSLVETRVFIEVKTIQLAAERRTEKDLLKLDKAHEEYVKHFNTSERVSYDFSFHKTIAESSHNPVFKAMLMIIIPDILEVYQREMICAPSNNILEEHTLMLEYIRSKDASKAGELMAEHLRGVLDFAKSRLTENSN